MPTKEVLDLIEKSVREKIDPLGYELIELKNFKESGILVLRFLVDRIGGGITLGECTQINRDIGVLFDEKNFIAETYNLEVSSPGLDRPLVSERDFKRVLNKNIHIFLKEPVDSKVEYEGELFNIENQGIKISNKEKQEVFIPFIKINKAKQVVK